MRTSRKPGNQPPVEGHLDLTPACQGAADDIWYLTAAGHFFFYYGAVTFKCTPLKKN